MNALIQARAAGVTYGATGILQVSQWKSLPYVFVTTLKPTGTLSKRFSKVAISESSASPVFPHLGHLMCSIQCDSVMRLSLGQEPSRPRSKQLTTSKQFKKFHLTPQAYSNDACYRFDSTSH